MSGTKVNGHHDFELTVSLNTGSGQLELDINKKLHIPSSDTLTPSMLQNLMSETTAIHARWSVLANQAAHAHDVAKIRFEVWEKQQLKRFRESIFASESKNKKLTERMVEEAVMADPDYLRRYEQVLEAKENASNIRSVAFAFGEKGERLVNISSLMKMEINRSSPTVSGHREREPRDADDSDRETRAFSSSQNDDEGEDA